MQSAKIGPNSLKAKQCNLRKGKFSHLLALGVLGLRWRRRNFEISCPPFWVLLVQVRKEEKEVMWSL